MGAIRLAESGGGAGVWRKWRRAGRGGAVAASGASREGAAAEGREGKGGEGAGRRFGGGCGGGRGAGLARGGAVVACVAAPRCCRALLGLASAGARALRALGVPRAGVRLCSLERGGSGAPVSGAGSAELRSSGRRPRAPRCPALLPGLGAGDGLRAFVQAWV